MKNLKEKYGPTALVAGASKGLGASWARALATKGLDLILLARRPEPLAEITRELTQKFGVKVLPLSIDLATPDATQQIITAIGDRPVDFLVCNAAASYIGPFLNTPLSTHQQIAAVNLLTPLALVRHFGEKMVNRRKGAIVLMSSIAGFQGSGFLATYAGTKTFLKVLAESLRRIGTTPSFVSGTVNKWVTFFMQHLLTKKIAIRIMSDGLKKMYRIVPLML
jgi:short-subunit dehydrogenase